MEKSKFGISTALLAAIIYLACYYGGITPTLLVVGAILILETNTEVKKHALRAAILLFAFIATDIYGFMDVSYFFVNFMFVMLFVLISCNHAFKEEVKELNYDNI